MYKVVEGRWGPCKILLKDEYVGRSVFYYGEYNPSETEMILGLAKGICLDIGANIGCISQALAFSGHTVIAFEPQPEIFALLDENTRGYHTPVKTYNCAVGSSAGVATMPKVHYSSKGNFGGLGIGDKSIYGNIEVPVITIDSLGIDCGFMKIDVEGYEIEVLRGAMETILRCRPVLYIEDDRPNNSQTLRSLIKSLDYTIEEHKPPLFSQPNFFGLGKNVWNKNYASHNIICRPC